LPHIPMPSTPSRRLIVRPGKNSSAAGLQRFETAPPCPTSQRDRKFLHDSMWALEVEARAGGEGKMAVCASMPDVLAVTGGSCTTILRLIDQPRGILLFTMQREFTVDRDDRGTFQKLRFFACFAALSHQAVKLVGEVRVSVPSWGRWRLEYRSRCRLEVAFRYSSRASTLSTACAGRIGGIARVQDKIC
jgi:hypothetical protein